MATSIRIGGLALLVCVIAAGPLPRAFCQSPDSQNQPRTLTLQGKVINSVTGNPIPRALVQITSGPQRALLTGPQGEFSFAGIAEGSVSLSVRKPGFFRSGDRSPNDSHPVAIQFGPETGNIILKLTPEAVIFGQVVGKNEEPVEGAIIQVVQAVRGGERPGSLVRGRVSQIISMMGGFRQPARTDEDGNFRIAGLPSGTYYLMLTTGSFLSRNVSRLRGDDPGYPAVVFYPGTPDVSSAMAIEVGAGQHLHADFALKAVVSFKVAGVIHWSEEWKQVRSPEIVDPNGTPLFVADHFDPSSGRFEFASLPAGSYTLRFGGTDQNGGYLAYYRKMTVEGPLANLQIGLRDPREIPVIVRKDFDRPLPPSRCTTSESGKTQVSDCSDYPPVFIQLTSEEYQRSTISSGFTPTRDPNAISLSGVMPGRYSVRAMSQFGGYVQSLRCGGIDLLRDALLVPEDGAVCPIEVTLRDDGASVKIRVHADGPSRSGWAVLVPTLLGRDPVVVDFKTNTDRDYGGIAPGDYKVFAFDSMDGIDYTDADALAKFSDKAAQITLGANGSSVISLDLIRTGD